jgi:plastocyanin
MHLRTFRLFAAGLLSGLLAAPAARAAGAVQVRCFDVKDQPVADAVIWLTPLDATVTVTPPAEPMVIEQQGEEFHPYVTPVVVGTRISFPNHDTVQHHIYSLSKPKRFEIPLYSGESKAAILFDQPGVVTLGCNIHDWMVAYVVVLATPYFARSGETGAAMITGLPPGRYRLEVWHPRHPDELTREVIVTGTEATPQIVTLKLKPDRRIRRAPDASGGGY